MQFDRGKSKALRVRLDHFRQRGRFDTARMVAWLVGGLVAFIYGGWILLGDRLGSNGQATHLSTGPLAQVHASFENDCDKCHAHGLSVAIGQHSASWNSEQRLQHQEQVCQNCHRVDHHYRDQLIDPALDRDCANCHREHQGKMTSLLENADKNCIGCHENLSRVCVTSASTSAPQQPLKIGRFDADHGLLQSDGRTQFRSLLKDTGRIKFDHAQHLQPGQIDPDRRGGMRLDQLSGMHRERYRQSGQTDEALIQLDCSSCHRLHSLEQPGQHVAADSDGRYYAPIHFEKHCSACHQLTIPGQSGDLLPLPHVATRAEYALLLTAKTPGRAISMNSDQASTNGPAVATATQPAATAYLDILFARCEQCHLTQDLTDESLAASLGGTHEPLIPERWLDRGAFDHAAHRRIERCQYCHEIPGSESATGEPSGPPTDHKHVFIRGPVSCTQCHRASDQPVSAALTSPEAVAALFGSATQPTWSSDRCSQCHRYHFHRPESKVAQRPGEELRR